MKQLTAFLLVVQLCSCTSHIYIVRHAEKAPVQGTMSATDPDLSAAGEQRAQALSTLLTGKGINGIFATQFKRTQQTARPTATAYNMPITLYTAAANDSLITALSTHQNKNYLVVGHSNTILPMIKKLGLNPTKTSIPETEFDNFYTVQITWLFKRRVVLKEATYGAATE
jgi:phosphohistidine phosphatase SixA